MRREPELDLDSIRSRTDELDRGFAQGEWSTRAGGVKRNTMTMVQADRPDLPSGGDTREFRRGGSQVLLVEDDVDIRSAVAGALLDEGYRVHEAETGAQALAWLRHADRTPCIILLDLMMPGLAGWELINSVRAGDRFVALPVLVTSGLHASRAPAKTAGFVRKRIDLDLTLALMRRQRVGVG